MEIFAVQTLLRCVDAFHGTCEIAPATLAKKAAGDWRFFDNLRGPDPTTFTVRKFDAVMAWFDGNWPADAARPACLDDWRALKQWEAAHGYSNSFAGWPRISVLASREQAAPAAPAGRADRAARSSGAGAGSSNRLARSMPSDHDPMGSRAGAEGPVS